MANKGLFQIMTLVKLKNKFSTSVQIWQQCIRFLNSNWGGFLLPTGGGKFREKVIQTHTRDKSFVKNMKYT